MVVIEELPSEPRREANEPAKAAKKKTKKEVDEEKEKIVKAAAKRLANKHFQEQARLKERFRRLMAALFCATIFLQLPTFEMRHPVYGRANASPIQIAAAFVSGARQSPDAPTAEPVDDWMVKAMLYPGAVWRNGWAFMHCHLRGSEKHCERPTLTWSNMLESKMPLLDPRGVREALDETFRDTLGRQLVVTGSMFLSVASLTTLVHSSAILSVIGAISHVYGCWKYKAMFKSGMFVIIYLVVMGSTRLPGTRKGPSVQERLDTIFKFEEALRKSGLSGKSGGEASGSGAVAKGDDDKAEAKGDTSEAKG